MESSKKERILIISSFAAIYIVWGSTYLASAFVVEEIEAFTSLAYRFCIAGILCLLILSLLPAKLNIKKTEFKNSVIAGVIFLGLGTGGAIWSLNYLD